MRRIALGFALAAIVISGCSKDKKTDKETNPSVKTDIAGTYALTTFIDGDLHTGSNVVYSSDKISCMLNNKLILNSDGSAVSKYAGNDTCYLVKGPTYSITSGSKGDTGTATWNLKGNNITLSVLTPTKYVSVGTIANEGGKVKITLRDTFPDGWTAVNAFIKE